MKEGQYLIIVGFFLFFQPVVTCQPFQLPCAIIDNKNYNTGNFDFSSSCIISPSVSSNPVNISGEAKVTYFADKSIHLQPGFHAGNFTGTGFFHATVAPLSIDVVTFTAYSGDPLAVLMFEKFELGIKLPSNTTQQINDFLSGTSGINPYNPDQIYIKVVFTSPTGRLRITNGFYYRDYIVDNINNIRIEQPTGYPWRVRFAPDETGQWSFDIGVYINGVNTINFSSGENHLNCISSGNKGYLEVGSDKRHLRFSSTQESFFALGQNIPYPLDVNANNLSNDPVDYEAYRGYINDLADKGGNYFRMRMDPWSNAIEWETLGNYDSRQQQAWETDKIFDVAHNRNLYIRLSLLQDQYFNDVFAYGGANRWTLENPYHTQMGLSNPIDFFTNTPAKEQYRKLLRYISARWGYSTNLAEYQLINETEGIEGYDNSNNQMHIAAWQDGMALFLKFYNDNTHLVSSGYQSKPENDDNSFESNNIDLISVNIYTSNKQQNYKTRYNVTDDMLDKYDKPFIIGELGSNPVCFHIDRCSDVTFHNALWGTAFMGSYGTGLYWDDWESDLHRDNLPAMSAFFSGINFETNQFTKPQRWKDGYTNNNKFEVIAVKTSNSEKIMGWAHQASVYWYNYYQNGSYATCYASVSSSAGCDAGGVTIYEPDDDDNYNAPTIFLGSGQKIKLTGLKIKKNYNVNWFDAQSTGAPFNAEALKTNLFGELKPSWPTGSQGFADYSFKSALSGISFKLSDPEDTDTLLCSDDTISVDGVYENDTSGIFQYYWDFGNGQTSTSAHPTVIYIIPGTYQLMLIVTDTNGIVDTLKQKLIKPDCTAPAPQAKMLSVNENQFYTSSFNLSPVPADNQITISLTSALNEIKTLYIYDALGRIILREILPPKKYLIHTIGLVDMCPGIYFLQIIGNDDVLSKKFIKK